MDIKELENLTLETLITLHRDRFDLRYASQSDLNRITTSDAHMSDGRAINDSLSDWALIPLEDFQHHDVMTFLTGTQACGYTMTSAVRHL